MEDKNNNINEPDSKYGNAFPFKSIKPSSFEALEQENRDYSLSLSPEERLAYLHQLNINAYGRQSLEIKTFERKLYW